MCRAVTVLAHQPAAKAHATFSTDDELALSYVVNSLDFWQVARDASLYWPRFLRVKLR